MFTLGGSGDFTLREKDIVMHYNVNTRALRMGLCAVSAAIVLIITGCDTMSERQRGTAVGAGVGAGVGAVIGSTTGGKAGTGAAVGGVLGAVVGNVWSKRMQDKREAMERATQGTGIEVARTPNEELKVNVPADFSFDVGRYDIKPSMKPILDQFANGLDPKMQVRVIGFTDSTGSDAVNKPLSINRAAAVRDYLSTRGIQSARVLVDGQGEAQPVADNSTDSGRAKNRRVEIFLREPQA